MVATRTARTAAVLYHPCGKRECALARRHVERDVHSIPYVVL